MADPTAELCEAVVRRDVAAIEAAVAAGANPDSAMHVSCFFGHLTCVRALLAAGADPNTAGHGAMFGNSTPLHTAAWHGYTQCIRALLAAGANPTAVDDSGWTPLATAVNNEKAEAAAALLEAAPELALLRDNRGRLPLQLAFEGIFNQGIAARCLLEQGALPPAAEVLALLEAARRHEFDSEEETCEEPDDSSYSAETTLPLYAPLVARQPLTPAEWARVPTPCPDLGPLLPAVLARSEAEAAQLVARLPAVDRERLRTAALCLRRTEREHGLELPPAILRPLLLAAVE